MPPTTQEFLAGVISGAKRVIGKLMDASERMYGEDGGKTKDIKFATPPSSEESICATQDTRPNQDERAHELFYNTIPDFGSLWDPQFVQNCNIIQKDYTDDVITCYRLHKVEFSRLMQRAGIAPKPDVRLDVQPSWNVPKDLNELECTEPEDGGVADDYDPDVGYMAEDGDEPEGVDTWEE